MSPPSIAPMDAGLATSVGPASLALRWSRRTPEREGLALRSCFRFRCVGKHPRRNFRRAADDEQRVPADQANLGLPVLIRAKISDIRRHYIIVATARLEFNKLHDDSPD